MNIVRQHFDIVFGHEGQTVRLNLWDPAMTEPANENDLEELEDVNYLLRQKYQDAMHFHAFMICFDITSTKSFGEAVDLYKELVRDPHNNKKISKYAKIPVCFVGTKLDLTDFIRSDEGALPRVARSVDLQEWVKKIHNRADSQVFEASSKENLNI